MEPVTHFLTGACLGRSGFNRKTAYATLAMTLAAEAPDIDMLSGLRGPVTNFCVHRGITHSLVGAPFMALADTGVVWCIAWLLLRMGRKPARPVRWGWIWLLCLIADLSHLLLDFTNNYGVRPFYPFSQHWYAWSIVYIFDAVLFSILVLGLALPAVFALVENEMRRPQPGQLRGRGWALAALCGVLLLYGLRSVEHQRAMQLTRQSGSTRNEPLLRVAAEPTMVSPFFWNTLMEMPGGYQVATVQTLAGGTVGVVDGETIARPPVTPAVVAARASYLGRVYTRWSTWPLIEDMGASLPPGDAGPLPPGAHTVRFSDMRFYVGALGGPDALSGWVVVGPNNEVVSQWMSGREQP